MEEDDLIIVVAVGALILFAIFAGVMAVLGARKTKRKNAALAAAGIDPEVEAERIRNLPRYTPGIWQIFIGVLWLASSALIFALYQTDGLSDSFSVPRFVAVFYDSLGVVGGSIVQAIIAALLLGNGIRVCIKVRGVRKLSPAPVLPA